MNIIADINNNYIRSICEIFRKKHNIIVFSGQKSVYDIIAKSSPDIVFCQNTDNLLLRAAIDYKLPTILYGFGKFEKDCNCIGVCVDKAELAAKPIVLPYFGSEKEYGGYYQYAYETDILFSSNYNFASLVRLYNYIYLNSPYKIKFAGRNIVNCCSFVGCTTNEEFGSLARSAKVVVTDNIYEHISLLFIGVCSVMAQDADKYLENCLDEKYRASYIEKETSNFTNNTVDIVAEKIAERIEEYDKTRISN